MTPKISLFSITMSGVPPFLETSVTRSSKSLGIDPPASLTRLIMLLGAPLYTS